MAVPKNITPEPVRQAAQSSGLKALKAGVVFALQAAQDCAQGLSKLWLLCRDEVRPPED